MVQLNVASVKAIAERHARTVDARLASTSTALVVAAHGWSFYREPRDESSVDERSLCSIDAEEVTSESTGLRLRVHGAQIGGKLCKLPSVSSARSKIEGQCLRYMCV